MLGIVLIFIIGGWYVKLAEQFNKNKWLFGILGIVTYYGSGFLIGIALAIAVDVFALDILTDIPPLVLRLYPLPIGLLSCYLLHRYLKHQWSKTDKRNDEKILDADLMK